MRKSIYILLFTLLSLVGCNDIRVEQQDSFDYRQVYLAASLGNSVMTRIPYIPTDDSGTAPDSPNEIFPLEASVWASTEEDIYEDLYLDGTNSNHDVAYHASANFTGGEPQLLREIIYSDGGRPIHFVGLYPKSTDAAPWTLSGDARSASYTFTGKEDVMVTSQVDGKYQNVDSEGNLIYPTLHFHHMLTLLRIELKAQSEAIRDTWGKLEEIKVRSKTKAHYGFEYGWESLTFEEEGALPFYKNGTDDVFPGATPYLIPYEGYDEVAYVMCYPVLADTDTDYVLDIKTEHRTISVNVNLKSAADAYFDGSTRGKQFTLSLNFKMGDNISVATSVKDWKTGGVVGGNMPE